MQSLVPNLERILVIGASARAAAASVKRAGYRPMAADLFCDSDLRSLCKCEVLAPYPGDAVRQVANAEADAWMYTGGLENHAPLVGQLARKLPLLGNGTDVLSGVRDPWRVAATLRVHGISVPETLPPGQFPKTGEWVCKPLRSCGGIGIFDWNSGQDKTSSEITSAYRETPERILQKRIKGQPVGALFVADTTHSQLLGVTEQLVGPNWLGAKDYMCAGSIGPVNLPSRGRQQLTVIGDALTSEFRLRGIFGVDAIWDGVDVWPVEVNPRYTASVEVLERALGISIVRAHVEACQDRLQPLALPDRPRQLCGKAVVYAQEKMVITPQLIDFVESTNSKEELPSIADIPYEAERIERGRPLVSLLADAPNSRQVVTRLKRLARSISFILYGRDLPNSEA